MPFDIRSLARSIYRAGLKVAVGLTVTCSNAATFFEMAGSLLMCSESDALPYSSCG